MDILRVYEERRRAFFATKFTLCPFCKSTKIHQRNAIEGCRPNGDVYGLTKFRCIDCDWKARFLFDDAADVYYYETKDWAPKTPLSV